MTYLCHNICHFLKCFAAVPRLIGMSTDANLPPITASPAADISALPEDGPAVAIVMAIVNTWLRAVMDAQHDTVPTVFVIEEGWHLMTGTFATITQRNQKISRGEALQNTTAMHHLSDVPPDSPAVATIKEAGTVVLYRQETLEDAKRCVELFNLPPATLATLMSLPQGTAIIKVGARKPVIVTHLRTAWEVLLTDTDSFDRYYGPLNAEWEQVQQENDFLSPFVSRSGFVRASLSPMAHAYTAPTDSRTTDVVTKLATDHLDRWLRWVDEAERVPVEEQAALAAYDLATRRNIADRDPANEMGDRLFGKDLTNTLVRALWGGDRELPRAHAWA